MKAEAMSFTFLGNEGVVKIPFFQRQYVWGKPNWEDILADLFDDQKNHFLGSLILKQQEKQTGKPNEVLVIDGQQRLTTLSVFVKALYDSFPEETKKNCDNTIKRYLLYKKNETDSVYHVKIQHSRLDSDYYKQVIESQVDNAMYQAINENSNKILQCYKYFCEELKAKNHQEKANTFNRIFDANNKIIVLIDLSEKEDEQAIFDTINSAGVWLSSADIIKNALFQKAIELNGPDNAIVLYKKYWDDIFLKDDDAMNFWSTRRSTGRLMRDNIEILLHSISVIKGFFDPDKHTLNDLSKLYKNYMKQFSKESLKEFLAEIAKYGQLYREKILTFEKSTLFSYNDNAQRLLQILDACEISTFHPYILSLFFKYEKEEAVLKEHLAKVEKYVVRRMIAKKETKSYNKTCKEFIAINSAIDTRLLETNDPEVLAGLQKMDNKNAALLLFWVELYRRHNDTKQSVKELKNNYSLEHILPQKWEEYWSGVPVKDSSGNAITVSDIAKKERYAKCYWIGNMTLLNSSLNTSLRNYIFEKKVNGDGKKKGIKSYADLTITNDDIVIPFDKGDKVWDEVKITNRTTNIGNEILSIWGGEVSTAAKAT